MTRWGFLAALAALGTTTALGAAGCGDEGTAGAVCGNKAKEKGETCDDGNTTPGDGCSDTCQLESAARTQVMITWGINANAVPGFNSDQCSSDEVLESGKNGLMQLRFDGPTSMTKTYPCSNGGVLEANLMPGDYTIGGTILEATPVAGGPPTTVPITSEVTQTVSIMTNQVPLAQTALNFDIAKFTRTYRGFLFFQVANYGGALTCENAMVDKQRFTLRRGGQILRVTTKGDATTPGQLTDGVATGACRIDIAGTTQVQTIEDLEWGPVEMQAEGLDASGAVKYCSRTPLFVGAGRANPIFALSVAAGPCPP
jgi:cysteine-rich repeat protein